MFQTYLKVLWDLNLYFQALLRRYSATETCHFKEPTNRSRPILETSLRVLWDLNLYLTALCISISKHSKQSKHTGQMNTNLVVELFSVLEVLRVLGDWEMGFGRFDNIFNIRVSCLKFQSTLWAHWVDECRFGCLWLAYSTLQHTATHCNTLQHTATHCHMLNTALWAP